jgi:hypothetical protein
MKKILFFASLFFVAACSQKNAGLSPAPIDTENQILTEIKQQPDITAKVVEQLPFKKMEVVLSLGSGSNCTSASFNYEIEYLNNGKIKTIKSDNKEMISIDYSTNQVSVNNGSTTDKYELGSDNLAKNTVDGLQKYYYKNGYLSRTISSSNPFIKNYSKEGNLIYLETDAQKSNYEYFDYPNNIRQEVLRPEAIHWGFRDHYLGKFSTNLLKKVTFINSATTLDFTYQFDSNNKVSKMIIERKSGNFSPANGIIEYTFSY